jgi:GGDEF domain-containing protein
VLEGAGFDVLYLGPDVPGDALVAAQLSRSKVTVSVGTATFRDGLRATARAVDMALYDAKEAGRNRVVSSGPGEHANWTPG